MLASTVDLVNLNVGSAAVLALLGYAVVFFGICLLMIVIMIMGKIFISKEAKATKKTVPATPAAAPVPPEAPTAPGVAGQLMLHDVEPKTAAMIMAIVADKLGKPLNELRFISIKEVK